MSEEGYWFGYLEAGPKSAPVLMDERLATSTGNPATRYLYNLARDQILEYKWEVVQPKLRPLKPEEQELAERLKAGYEEARKAFSPRGVPTAPPAGTAEPPTAQPGEEEAEGLEDEEALDEVAELDAADLEAEVLEEDLGLEEGDEADEEEEL